MADPKGFLKVFRKNSSYRPVCERVLDYQDVISSRSEIEAREQSSRCMDCGTPFCHSACPITNLIPEWNDALFLGQFEKAYKLLADTNHLPEVTGRVCPAPCEYGCVLGINDDAVTIRENELSIIETAFEKGLVKSQAPLKRTGKKIAVVGSGPAGIAAACELNQFGHEVTLFEKDDRVGGLMRYGIPDFKLEKWVLDRRFQKMEEEGIKFVTGVEIGKDYLVSKLKKEFDAILLTTGSRVPRDLKLPGRELSGIYFAMDYLKQSNQRVAGDKITSKDLIDAKGKKVVVIGGGDTGSDCVGTANRQGANCVVQIEVMEKPSEERTSDAPWPLYPRLYKTTSSHEEGSERHFEVLTQKFEGEAGQVKRLICLKGEEKEEMVIEADLVLLAIGFLHPEKETLLAELEVKLTDRGNILTDDDFKTSLSGVFAAGDCHRGQSLIVWAIAEGIQAARSICKTLI